MAKELLVNVSRGEEVRVALVEDGRLEEIYLERDSAASNVGNIYLGKVTNVEGSIQAAFVDFGYGRNGFLHVQDLHPDYFPEGGKWDRMSERVGKKIGRRDRPPIQDCLRRGDHIVVQIIKEGIGTKGPTLTSYPSIPGRMLVAMPGVGQMGVSKNIEDEKERRRLRKILDGLEPPKDVGFIIRTAGEGKTKAEIERDFKYLSRLWQDIDKQRKTSRPPALLYSEGDLVTRTVRDVYSSDVDRIVVDDVETALRIKQFFKLLMPRTKVDVELYQGDVPLFHATGVEQEIETMFSRHVPLANGGSLVIDSTEAVVAIDVNTGKFREHGDAEETAFRMDMEAADEICRQLRLRDLGGVVICDFIDLRYSRHRQQLFDRLTENFKRDKAKSRHLAMSEFGIVEITRQRMRPDLKKSVFMPCPWSNGTGYIKTPESMALDVMRRLRVAASDDRVRRIVVRLYPTAAIHMLNRKRQAVAELERQYNKTIELRPDDTLAADAVELDLFDERDMPVQVAALAVIEAEKPDQGHKRRRGGRRRRKSDDTQGGPPDTEIGDDGLIELDDLITLGDMKLEEVEQLAQQAAAERDRAEHDPLNAILNALRERPSEPSTNGDVVADAEEEEKPRGRRRRRRGGRDRDEAIAERRTSTVDETDTEPEAEVKTGTKERADEEADERPRGRRRRRRRGGRDREETAETLSREPAREAVETEEDVEAEPAPEVQLEAEPETEERPAERHRRRRRRRRGGRDREETTASAPRDAVAEFVVGPAEVVSEPVEVVSEPVDADTEEEPVGAGSAPAAETEEPPADRRGRRRRRRGKRRESEEAVAEEPAEPETPAVAEDEDSASRDVEDVVEVPDAEPEVETEAHEEAVDQDEEDEVPTRRPRPRRSRGRAGRNRPQPPVSSDATADEAGDDVAETTAAKEPEPVEPEPADQEPVAERSTRRRRNRGKVTRARPIATKAAVATAPATTPPPADALEPAPGKKAAKKAPKKTARKAAKKTPKKVAKAPKKTPKRVKKTTKKATA